MLCHWKALYLFLFHLPRCCLDAATSFLFPYFLSLLRLFRKWAWFFLCGIGPAPNLLPEPRHLRQKRWDYFISIKVKLRCNERVLVHPQPHRDSLNSGFILIILCSIILQSFIKWTTASQTHVFSFQRVFLLNHFWVWVAFLPLSHLH